MTNLEIMERGLDFTYDLYMKWGQDPKRREELSKTMQPEEVEKMLSPENLAIGAHNFAANAIIGTMHGPSRNYTRQGGLRDQMASIGADGIKNELLKNAVNVAAYHRHEDTIFGNTLANQVAPGMADSQIAVVLLNHITAYGAESAYRLLDNPEILASACRTFEWARGQQNRASFDYASEAFGNRETIAAIESLDVHYARWGRQSPYQQQETSYGR